MMLSANGEPSSGTSARSYTGHLLWSNELNSRGRQHRKVAVPLPLTVPWLMASIAVG